MPAGTRDHKQPKSASAACWGVMFGWFAGDMQHACRMLQPASVAFTTRLGQAVQDMSAAVRQPCAGCICLYAFLRPLVTAGQQTPTPDRVFSCVLQVAPEAPSSFGGGGYHPGKRRAWMTICRYSQFSHSASHCGYGRSRSICTRTQPAAGVHQLTNGGYRYVAPQPT